MPTEFCVGRNPEVVVAEARSQAVEAAEASLGEEGIQVEVERAQWQIQGAEEEEAEGEVRK